MLPPLRHWLISKLGARPTEKYSIYRDPRILPFVNDKIITQSNALLSWRVFGIDNMDELANGLRGLEYYEFHKFRFLEMINAISYLSSKLEMKELLEIGTIFSTKLINACYPSINISTVDRYQEEEIGYEGVFRIKDITKAHYTIDFLVADIEHIQLQPDRPFDAVLFCEVIEHLLLHPRKIINFIFNNLLAGGYLYLTTPNAFDKRKVQRFLERDFPFPVYPYNFKLSDAHMHHIREYGMSEILEACTECGFQVRAFYFSACWDEDKNASSFDNDELGNLVVLAQKP